MLIEGEDGATTGVVGVATGDGPAGRGLTGSPGGRSGAVGGPDHGFVGVGAGVTGLAGDGLGGVGLGPTGPIPTWGQWLAPTGMMMPAPLGCCSCGKAKAVRSSAIWSMGVPRSWVRPS